MNELEVLRNTIRARMNDIADSLANGTCASFEDYRRMCGVIEGLAYAERELLDIKEKQED